MIVLLVLSFLLAAVQAEPQLIGHRGIFTLREGQVYRDEETVRASEAAARFALLTERDEQILHRSRKYESQQFGLFPPPLYSSHIPAVLGRPLKQNEIFDVLDSKFVNVFPENEFNKFLDEVEIEKATAPTRSFPGEPLPQGHPAPTRAPNRLIDLSKPLEDSERTKNSNIGTIFDGSSQHPASIDRPPVSHGLGPDDGPLRPFVHIGGDGPQAAGGPGPGPGPLQPISGPLHSPLLDQAPSLPVQQFFGEPALDYADYGSPLGASGSLLPQDNTGSFVNLGNNGPQPVNSQPSFSTFVQEEPFSNPLRPFEQGPGPVPEVAGLEGHIPFVNLGPGSGPGPLGALGSAGPGPEHQGTFVDLGSPGATGDIFENRPGGLGRSLTVGQHW